MSGSILIADDDPNIVLALKFLTERAGFRVRVATDGEAVLAAIAEERPDLVLLDVMMPKRSGHDVCAAIRANPLYADIRIMMLTARGRDSERSLGLRMGADDYVTKPFSTRDVLKRVCELLGMPYREAAAPKPDALKPDALKPGALKPGALERE